MRLTGAVVTTWSVKQEVVGSSPFKANIFTARKRSLGQSNIFSSESQEFSSKWGGRWSAWVHAGIPPPGPGTPTPSLGADPPEQTPPGPGTPQDEAPFWVHTPLSRRRYPRGADISLRSACWEIRSTSGRYQWRIQDFPQGGRQLPKLLLFFTFLPKTAWKWKNLDPRGGGRASLAPPLDPPMGMHPTGMQSCCHGFCENI